jgi:TIR domain
MGAVGQIGLQPEPHVLRIFISYASEDLKIALAIANAFRVALGDVFAEINIDKWFLQAGDEFKKQIELKLDKTDIFVIVYTGAEKQSHSFSGWEVGYFDHIMKTSPNRKKIPLFLDYAPITAEGVQGIALNIPRLTLQLDLKEFESALQVDEKDPMCVLLVELQEQVDDIRAAGGYHRAEKKPDQDPVARVREMKTQIFRYLKSTVETTLKPQKQIVIRTKGGTLHANDGDLPADADFVPTVGSMEIFGLPDNPMTWQQFLQSTAENKFSDSWREAITSVIISSLPDKINVDNSQIIVSNDEAKTYRLILTTATKCYDDNREFNLYFVETLRRPDYGDASTTRLLKGLELSCRFRFMFLEGNSEFSGRNLMATTLSRIPQMAKSLLQELNLLRKDSREAGLDKPAVWSNYMNWDDINTMTEEYRPREMKLREVLGQIIASKDEAERIEPLRKNLTDILSEMEEHVRPTNTILIRDMAEKLQTMIKESEHEAPHTGL